MPCPSSLLDAPSKIPAINHHHHPLLKENFLSEFLTEWEKLRVRENLGIEGVNGCSLEWGNIAGDIKNQSDLIDYIQNQIKINVPDISDQLKDLMENWNFEDLLKAKVDADYPESEGAVNLISYENSDYPDMKTLKDALDLILYSKPVISRFTVTPNTIERGESVPSVTVQWNCNKKVTAKLDGTEVTLKSFTQNGPFNTTKTFTLVVTDGKSSASATASITVKDRIYFGVYLKNELTEAIVRNLFNSALVSSRVGTYEINNIGEGQYGYLCIPTILGEPTSLAKENSLAGGFDLVDSNFIVTKFENNPITYRVYRTTYPNIGNVRIVVK